MHLSVLCHLIASHIILVIIMRFILASFYLIYSLLSFYMVLGYLINLRILYLTQISFECCFPSLDYLHVWHIVASLHHCIIVWTTEGSHMVKKIVKTHMLQWLNTDILRNSNLFFGLHDCEPLVLLAIIG